jgi:D-alanine-D-alanine ligase
MNWANKKVAVIMGGLSAEREVSLNSGAAVLKALKSDGVNAFTVDGVEELLNYNVSEIDAVFNILHGEAGENGELAALLSCLKIPFTGTKQKGAVLSWNKDIAKLLIKEIGIKTPNSQTIKNLTELRDPGNGPWIVKPTQEGSSVGLYYADTLIKLKLVIEKALQKVDSILVEQFIQGQECTVTIINDEVLPVIRIKPQIGLYDYEAKYQSHNTEYFCPSGFDQKLEGELKTDAFKAYKELDLYGWARIDFIVDKNLNRWFLEANTTPGMTETSLVPKAAKVHGWSFIKLVRQILNSANQGDFNVQG